VFAQIVFARSRAGVLCVFSFAPRDGHRLLSTWTDLVHQTRSETTPFPQQQGAKHGRGPLPAQLSCEVRCCRRTVVLGKTGTRPSAESTRLPVVAVDAASSPSTLLRRRRRCFVAVDAAAKRAPSRCSPFDAALGCLPRCGSRTPSRPPYRLRAVAGNSLSCTKHCECHRLGTTIGSGI
jgi:hypothetical protein